MKKIITIIIILAILFIGFLIFSSKTPNGEVDVQTEDKLADTIKSDIITTIDEDFQQEIDVGNMDIDIDKEFESLEGDLQSL